jgi:hypothetical protein
MIENTEKEKPEKIEEYYDIYFKTNEQNYKKLIKRQKKLLEKEQKQIEVN